MPVALKPTVWIDADARSLIAAQASSRKRTESGGALLGFGDRDVVVACAYGPGPRAKHRRAAFEPHPATTQAVIDAVFAASEARYRYLGSWHSHPLGAPRPSGTDITTTEAVANDLGVGLPEPIVLIQATRGAAGGGVQAGELRAWRWSARERWLLPCELRVLELEHPYCPVIELPRGRFKHPVRMAPAPG
jgi:integrative and conjugative element protein (TIGR02256 family)